LQVASPKTPRFLLLRVGSVSEKVVGNDCTVAQFTLLLSARLCSSEFFFSVLEVCMGVGNPMGIPFPWESHGNGNSHAAHDGNGNGNGNKANGNGNSIYFTRVKIPKIIVMH